MLHSALGRSLQIGMSANWLVSMVTAMGWIKGIPPVFVNALVSLIHNASYKHCRPGPPNFHLVVGHVGNPGLSEPISA